MLSIRTKDAVGNGMTNVCVTMVLPTSISITDKIVCQNMIDDFHKGTSHHYSNINNNGIAIQYFKTKNIRWHCMHRQFKRDKEIYGNLCEVEQQQNRQNMYGDADGDGKGASVVGSDYMGNSDKK